MKIGIVGPGRIGPGLGALWARVGHRVVLGTCDDRPRSAPGLPVGVHEARECPGAVASADVVLLAARPEDLEGYLEALGPLEGRVVVTPYGPDVEAPDGRPLLAWLEARLPAAHVVQAFGNVRWSFSDGPAGAGEVPVRAAHPHARALVSGLIADLRLSAAEAAEDAFWPTVYLPAVTA
jgi:predicted dinucleotide-binding enzyme